MTERRPDGTYITGTPHLGNQGEQKAAGVGGQDGYTAASIKVANYRRDTTPPPPPSVPPGNSGSYTPPLPLQTSSNSQPPGTTRPSRSYGGGSSGSEFEHMAIGFVEFLKFLKTPPGLVIIGFLGYCLYTGEKSAHPPGQATRTQATSVSTAKIAPPPARSAPPQLTGFGAHKFDQPPAHPVQIVSRYTTTSLEQTMTLAKLESTMRIAPVKDNVAMIESNLVFAECKKEISDKKAYFLSSTTPQDAISHALNNDYCTLFINPSRAAIMAQKYAESLAQRHPR